MPDPYWEKVGQEAKKAEALRNLGAQADRKLEPKQGHRKRIWRCTSCSQDTWEHWIILNRASRPKCPGCGSLSYEPKTAEAKDDMAANRSVRKVVDGPQGTGNGTFVVGS